MAVAGKEKKKKQFSWEWLEEVADKLSCYCYFRFFLPRRHVSWASPLTVIFFICTCLSIVFMFEYFVYF